ncbi:MAG: potassium transporter TrkA [Gemmatales bacterium]|nr:MAG: potassium transporter TrkA [Gemmatales bacterium]
MAGLLRALIESAEILLKQRLFLVPLLLVAVGTLGYMVLEDLPPFDALYFTIITLTTIGYGDFTPATDGGKAFTMGLVLIGVFTFFYVASEVLRTIVSGELGATLGKRYMERALATMHKHYIVCGFGRMGRLVCREFEQSKTPYVAIDRNAEGLAHFCFESGLFLEGDATSDEVLKRAGIEKAQALITVMSSDADNLYTTMSARLLNPDLYIVSRIEELQSEQKLLRAGANRVVSPYRIGGRSMVQAVLRPNVLEFIELTTRTEHIDLQLEEVAIGHKSSLIGTTLDPGRVRQQWKVIVVAVKKADAQLVFDALSDTVAEPGDVLLCLGSKEALERLEEAASGKE